MSITVMKPVDEQDKINLYKFLYQLWSREFDRDMPGMDHEKEQFKDELDDWAHHFIAIDEAGRIVGCIRTNFLRDGDLDEELTEKMAVKKMSAAVGKDNISYTSHLAVAPDARGRTVASLLVSTMIGFFVKQDILADISYCTLNLTHMYYQIGSRPYTDNFRINDVGLRMPLVFCTLDADYLKSIESPALRIIPEELNDGGRTAAKISGHCTGFCHPGFDKVSTKALWARISYSNPGDGLEIPSLLEGFNADELSSVMEHVTKVTFNAGDHIYHKGEKEPGMGVVLTGSLGISVGKDNEQRYVAVLKPGEPFGEMMMLGQVKKRSADVVALEKTEALLFAPNVIERVGKLSSELGFRLSVNLSKILAKRLVNANHILADIGGSMIKDLHVKRQANYQGVASQENIDHKESYQFSKFDDQKSEYERLKIQAVVAERIEFGILEGVGLSGGQTVLDLGSGPGVTSSLIAMRHTTNQVVGVEPDETLRETATNFVEKQGLASRCKFIEGTAEEIPIDKNSFDFTYARLLFQHLPDKLKALKEMMRVTKPGGIVCVLDADDQSIILQPEIPGWKHVEELAATAQAGYGGDRYVGRKLYGLMKEAGLNNVKTSVFTVTMDDLGREAFFEIVFGFKKQLLMRINEWNDENKRVFAQVYETLKVPHGFGMTNVFVGHGVK